jgi:hypothetical protein
MPRGPKGEIGTAIGSAWFAAERFFCAQAPRIGGASVGWEPAQAQSQPISHVAPD